MPVTYITAKPAVSPARTGPVPRYRRIGRSPATCARICTVTCAMAPTPSARKTTDQIGEYTNPPSHAPAIVGTPPIRPSAEQRRQGRPGAVAVVARQRRDDRQALGRVVQREADDQQAAKRRFAQRERGADGQALAEVVQADADRDEQRQHHAGAAGGARARAPVAQPVAEAPRDRETPPRPRTRRARCPGTTQAPAADDSSDSAAASTSRNISRPTVSASTKSSPRRPSRPINGNHSSPIATGTTPTYSPISANVQKVDDDGTGVATATAIVWSKVRPCAGDEPHDVRLAMHPRVRNLQARPTQVRQGRRRLRREMSRTRRRPLPARWSTRSGPSLRTSTVMPSLASVTRWNASFSTGG